MFCEGKRQVLGRTNSSFFLWNATHRLARLAVTAIIKHATQLSGQCMYVLPLAPASYVRQISLKKSIKRQLVSEQRFEPRTLQIRSRNANIATAFSGRLLTCRQSNLSLLPTIPTFTFQKRFPRKTDRARGIVHIPKKDRENSSVSIVTKLRVE